jgi:hypothetical protein
MNHGYAVKATDLYNYGYIFTSGPEYDFLEYDVKGSFGYPNGYPAIITNPPYNLAEEFVWKSLEVTKGLNGKVALLLRLSFLEGQRRQAMFKETPLKKVHVFSKRITFVRPGDEGKNYSGMMAYAWFVWDWTYEGEPTLGWI